MSAWQVSDTHLSALVQSAVVEQVIPPFMADELWKRMKWNNMWALHVRYMDDAPETWTKVELNRDSIEAPLRPAAVWKGIRCWGYQCAEWDGFDQTPEYKIMEELAKKLQYDNHIPDEMGHDWANDEPWGISEWKEIVDAVNHEAG